MMPRVLAVCLMCSRKTSKSTLRRDAAGWLYIGDWKFVCPDCADAWKAQCALRESTL